MIDYEKITSRLKKHLKLEKDKDLAKLMKLSAPDFSRRKKQGTILPQIVEAGIINNVDFNWLLIGESGEPATLEPSDLKLMGDIIESLERILQEEGTNLPPDKKRQLIELLYQRFRKTGEKADKEVMREHLRLIAA